MTSSALHAFVAGLALMAGLIVCIGAQNLFVLRQGLRRAHVAPVVALCVALDLGLTTAGVAGLGGALAGRPAAWRALGAAGALVLATCATLAVRRVLAPRAMRAAAQAGAPPLGTVLAQALALTLLNPHVYLDTVLLLGSVGARQPGTLRPAFVAGAGAASALWFCGLGYGARWLAPVFARPAAWRVLDGLVAATMSALAASLALGAWRG